MSSVLRFAAVIGVVLGELLGVLLGVVPSALAAETAKQQEVGLVADYSPARSTHVIVRGDGTTTPVKLGTMVMAGDIVRVTGSGHVFVQLNDGTQRDVGAGEWRVPDAKPLGAIASLLRSLPRLLDVQARIAASASTRSGEACGSAAPPSPIDAPILRERSLVVAGKQNIALGWFGGCAPFSVALSSGDKVIGSAKDLTRRQHQFVDANLTTGNYELRIEDARGNHRQYGIEAVTATPEPPADLGDADTATVSIARALWLAELDQGAWRLESFKTLRPLMAQKEKIAALIGDYLLVAAEEPAPAATKAP